MFQLINPRTRAWFLLAVVVSAQTLVVLAADTERGFKALFDGKGLAGWDGNPKLWSVKEGAITGQTTAENPAKGNTFLIWTNGTTSDFELRCSFRLVPGDDKNFANSGIQYRSKVLDPDNWVVGGYQGDMEAGPTYTGILYEERMKRGIMAARGEKVVWDKDCNKQVTGSVGDAEAIQASIKQAGWNEYTIIAQGNHLQHFVNGKQTVDVTDECEAQRATSGVLALQLHAGPPMMAQFKDIRLRTLDKGSRSAEVDLENMQGVWQATEVTRNGAPAAAEDLANVAVTIKGNGYHLVTDEGNIDGSFTLDASPALKHMNVQPGGGSDAGTRLLAIYEISPDTLRVCYAAEGGERPTEFSSSADSKRTLVIYKRKN